ncbi:MAG: DUF4174 domain-containing protein [Rhodobacterales bacterium]|jgi:hypothetical protein|nr:DUF4174 domain-containing protein [Pseudomonadota bacterium]MDA1285706.1 DUF4174 domain-containing protein [Pseudomonadota bacterium]NQW15211.1 DUF4174 domain-containing protein [Rhodobacter sp.]
MRRIIPFILLLISPMAMAQTVDPLAEYVWLSRLLVIFADSPDDPRYTRQIEMLDSDPDALTERQIVLLVDTDPAANGPLRQKMHPHGFMLVVIDKDGSILFRKPTPWSVRELSRAIDKTPFRMDEIDEALGK